MQSTEYSNFITNCLQNFKLEEEHPKFSTINNLITVKKELLEKILEIYAGSILMVVNQQIQIQIMMRGI